MNDPGSARRRAACDGALLELLDALRVPESSDRFSRHPDAATLMEAGYEELTGEGLPQDAALLLAQMPALVRHTRRLRFGEHPRFTSADRCGAYLRTFFYGVNVERFYLLTLSENGRVIRCTLLQEGTADETPFYLSRVLMTAAADSAYAAVLCHNHPGGTAKPSPADLNCTLNAVCALHPMGVILLDHIIIARDKVCSMRLRGDISAELWLRQAPESRLLRGWTKREEAPDD